ncbi:hypothetical protein [Nocardioides sp. R-C-SC26]|uniref:hypothetical protein n=1 Tax=Nocardioides sp. R-C-SC26 TaxID=2870414 RepID=UPI001E32C0E4|nr:hypothetical protein [Nocardioides sp. R-C-SC26]
MRGGSTGLPPDGTWTDLQAHGLGGQKDLPIPLDLAVAGAVAALVVSFTVLALAWRRSRFDRPDAESAGRPAPAWLQTIVGSRAFTLALRGFGMVVFAYTAFAAVFGRDSTINPFFGIFLVWLWVGLVPMSLLFGPFWKAISPVRTINRAFAAIAGTDPAEGLYSYRERWGYWPAAIGLYAFVWFELVYPHLTELGPARFWCATYVAIMLIGGALFGERFYERADPFEVYSTLVAKLSPWATHEGRLLLRNPLANLATTVPGPGLIVVVGILFGSTGYDSFRESPTFVTFVQESSLHGDLLRNAALIVFCIGATLALILGTMAMGLSSWVPAPVRAVLARVRSGTAPTPADSLLPDGVRRRALPSLFAHSIVPIIVGYMIAHYLTYLIETGSRTLILASDPLSRGSNLLGTADWQQVTWLSYHPTLLANIKVLAVVIGHVVAAVAAHDRAVRLLPARHQLTGQLPLLIAMVGFTSGGLYLLFSS